MLSLNDFKDRLCCILPRPSDIKADLLDKKKVNQVAFMGIDRKGLVNEVNERLMLMYTTYTEELVFIEYPGKESNPRNVKKVNKYDFRPELFIGDSGHFKDEDFTARLSLSDIFHALEKYYDALVERYGASESKKIMQILASLIIRLAYMEDYSLINTDIDRIDIDFLSGERAFLEWKSETIEFYCLDFNEDERELMASLPYILVPNYNYRDIRISLEGLLYYLDLLAQQEDCKYNSFGYGPGAVGRINCLLTIVNVIDRIINGRSYADIKIKCASGVSPIKVAEFNNVTGGIITMR